VLDKKEWAKAALVRAIKTFCQTCIALIPMGVTVEQVGWHDVISTAALAFIVSILTSAAGLPEVDANEALQMYEDGRANVRDDNSDENTDNKG
jgi:hypothetical protein